jgi:hypothetical protein
MINEHDRIVLTAEHPEAKLAAGDVGVVVHVYAGAKAYEVEFVALDGGTLAVVTLDARHVRPVRSGEIAHARSLSAA